ncbi:hypothetical protein [Celerinatantimonas yamalensis]|uniref:Uncharacterized protein n=1 Tax=Celerinatantimonas yamalensis TaxID=559956 RepID=A0ABW9G446_9GAMM
MASIKWLGSLGQGSNPKKLGEYITQFQFTDLDILCMYVQFFASPVSND